MKKSNFIRVIVIFWIFVSSFIFISHEFIGYSQAAPNGHSLSINNTDCKIREYSRHQGKIGNISSIDINLPSSNWNITNIDINFTDIRLEKEQMIIESQSGGFEKVYKKNSQFNELALFNQLNISEQTTLFGVYIYGVNTTSITNITFQIRGYNSVTNNPNGSIYASIPLNMSSIPGWYLQNFSSSPIILQKGNYSLVINGTEKRNFPVSDLSYIAWYHNGPAPPTTPNLYSGGYDLLNGWLTPQINRTFMHKLIQKTNKPYNPEDINMMAIYNGTSYKVTNNFGLGGGNLSLQCNNKLIVNLLEIMITNNQSVLLNFTINYSVSLTRISILESTLLIREDFDNNWNLIFAIDRTNFYFYRIEINFSIFNWNNITIYEGGVNVTSPSILDETNKTIILSNNTIEDGLTNWRITANSSKINFQLDFPSSLLTIERGQILRFTVSAPKGNLTFSAVDINGYEEFRSEAVLLSDGDYIFGHPIPSKAIAGGWKIFVYWNNNTDAGVLSQEFTVSVPFTIDPQVLMITLIIIGILLIVGVSSYQTIKITKKYYDEKKRRVLNTVTDILNIKYFMITEKNSGLNIYEQKIGKGKQDSMLIAGYLDAISKFEIALTDSEYRSQSIKLEYQDSKILMSEFKSFRIILIMKQNPSKYILSSIEKLSYDIDNKYGEFFKNFTGELRNFQGLDNLIEKHLHISLIYPHKISYKNIEELNKAERKMIKRATDIIKTTPHFYILFLIPENEWKYRNFKTILKLIEKKVFQPIKPESEQLKLK